MSALLVLVKTGMVFGLLAAVLFVLKKTDGLGGRARGGLLEVRGTTRLGDRIRVGGTAEIAGYDNRLRPHRRGPLDRSLRDLFPTAGDASKASFWCGLRPMTPDGTPVLGRAPGLPNLFLNTGHGTLGWTMAAGSGKVLADMVSGKQPEIDISDLGLSRYGR